MGLTEIMFGISNASIGLADSPVIGKITLDASVSEVHSAKATATRHPVETGSEITDHVLVAPLTVKIDGVVTNYPLETLASVTYAGRDLAGEAYDSLLYKLLDGQLCTIVTTLTTYDDMVLEMLEVPRDAKRGNALHFSAQAVQIKTVELTGAIATSTAGGRGTGSAGTKPAVEATPQQTTANGSIIGKTTGWTGKAQAIFR